MPSTGWPSISDPPAATTRSARAYWLGRVGYGEACALQHALAGARQRGEIPDTFLFLEHPPVITLGRAAHEENLVAPRTLLAARGVELWETTRGGDVTYHGPGQLVGYGIVDLKDHGRDVAAYLRSLEQALIALLSGYGLVGERHPEYTGVWLGHEKVCAMGVRVERWVTSHGFALNVAAELSNFDLIVPCGIRGRGVTSVERATGRPFDLEAVAADAATALASTFGWRMERGDAGELDLPAAAGDRIPGGVRRLVPVPGE